MFVLPSPVCTMVGSRFNALASHYHHHNTASLSTGSIHGTVTMPATLFPVLRPWQTCHHSNHITDGTDETARWLVIGLQINHCANNNSTFVYWKSTRVHRYYTFVFSIIFLCPAGPCLSRSPPVWCVIAESSQCSTVALKVQLLETQDPVGHQRGVRTNGLYHGLFTRYQYQYQQMDVLKLTDGRSIMCGRGNGVIWYLFLSQEQCPQTIGKRGNGQIYPTNSSMYMAKSLKLPTLGGVMMMMMVVLHRSRLPLKETLFSNVSYSFVVFCELNITTDRVGS